jgi:hypothetical protein
MQAAVPTSKAELGAPWRFFDIVYVPGEVILRHLLTGTANEKELKISIIVSKTKNLVMKRVQ